MHIGFLTPEYPHLRVLSSAGIGTSINNMAVALAAKGVTVSIFVYGQEEDDIFLDDGIKIHLIRQQKFKLLGWYLYRKFLQNYLNKYIAVDKIEAIEAPDWTGITAFMKLRCPLVIRMNGSDAYFCSLENRPQKKKNFWFERSALEGADYLLSVSRFTAVKTAEIFDLEKEIKVIPNSINTTVFKPGKTEAQSNRILYFGTIIRKKGLLELAGIFNLLVEKKPEVELILAGKDVIDTKTKKSTQNLMMEKLSSKAKERVVFTGKLPYGEVLAQIGMAEVVVLPSFAEALPMTWLEAMAMEKALVTSDIGWAKEVMIDGETGFTENPHNHRSFAEKILYLLENPVDAGQMGKAARQQIKLKFSTEVVVKQNIDFYRKIIES